MVVTILWLYLCYSRVNRNTSSHSIKHNTASSQNKYWVREMYPRTHSRKLTAPYSSVTKVHDHRWQQPFIHCRACGRGRGSGSLRAHIQAMLWLNTRQSCLQHHTRGREDLGVSTKDVHIGRGSTPWNSDIQLWLQGTPQTTRNWVTHTHIGHMAEYHCKELAPTILTATLLWKANSPSKMTL